MLRGDKAELNSTPQPRLEGLCLHFLLIFDAMSLLNQSRRRRL